MKMSWKEAWRKVMGERKKAIRENEEKEVRCGQERQKRNKRR